MTKHYSISNNQNHNGLSYYVTINSTNTTIEVSETVYNQFERWEKDDKNEARYERRRNTLSLQMKYEDDCSLEDFIASTNSSFNETVLNKLFLEHVTDFVEKNCDTLDIEIFHCIILSGETVTKFSSKKEIARTTINYRKKKLIQLIKNNLKIS